MTVEQIHQLGLEEVERIQTEMKDIVTEMGYSNLTLQQFTDMIRYQPGVPMISTGFISSRWC